MFAAVAGPATAVVAVDVVAAEVGGVTGGGALLAASTSPPKTTAIFRVAGSYFRIARNIRPARGAMDATLAWRLGSMQ